MNRVGYLDEQHPMTAPQPGNRLWGTLVLLTVRQFDDGFFDVVRKLNREEPITWIEIVFVLFIDHAHHVVRLSGRILEDFVDLAGLERGFLIFVLDANSEMSVPFSHRLGSRRFEDGQQLLTTRS